jgi:hypothetical protein
MLLGLTLGLLFFCMNVVGFNFDFYPGDLGDGRLNLYFLEHAHRFFTGKVASFWNAPFMYPQPNVIAYSDNLLGSAPFYSLLRLLGFDLYMSYQLWFMVVTGLNYITAFYFLKYICRNSYAAVLGAFVFAFSIALQSQLTHAQTFPRFAIPIAFLMAAKYSETLNPRYILYTLLAWVYQMYCGIYLGLMLAVPLGIFVALTAIKDAKHDRIVSYDARWYRQVTVYFLISLLILLPLLIPYLGRNIAPTIGRLREISATIPTIKSHFYSQEGSLAWDFLSKTGQNYPAWWDHQIFAGGIATFCLLVCLVWLLYGLKKAKFSLAGLSTTKLMLLTGLFTFVLYIRLAGVSAYYIIYFLPGFSAMRSITRIINIELIFFAIATAFVFARLIGNRPRYGLLLFLVAFSLTVGDNYFYRDKSYRTLVSKAKARTAGLEETFAQIPQGSIVSYEPRVLESSPIDYQIDAMLASQKYGLIAVNGYTATCPGDYSEYWNNPNKASRNTWLKGKLSAHNFIYVISSPDSVKKLSVGEITNNEVELSREQKIENLLKKIQADEKWMKDIERKAKEEGISADSMITLDAIRLVERE